MKIKVPNCMAVTIQDRRWFVVRVKGGMADSVFAELREAGYDVYLPRRRYDKQNRRLRVLTERSEPLMPNYVFIVHPRPEQVADDWSEVRGINGVVGPLKGAVGPLLIPAKVIEVMMTAEFEGVYDETKAAKRARGETDRSRLEKRFGIGRQFIVTEGPFATFLAEVETLTHDDRVKALVNIFGRMTPVEFEPDHLEDLPKKRKRKVA
ncbi:transcription termination/antitermination protein NusG [Aquamicrobium soli]|uniref:Transcription termination/antitermination protein NusG n=1 Tax=Aquamicrobium soli TaxID=1811518 RepID=A0ABV7KEH6_9HYPH